MTHLHIPDGVLPLVVWAPALGAALALLIVSAWATHREARPQLAFQSAMGALMLAAMAIELPLGPLEYHLSLVGPVGVLLGPASAFQVVFVVSAMLALIGHGGLTVVGLNALVLGAGAALARPLARAFGARLDPAVSMAVATACAQALSGALWLAVMAWSLKLGARGRVLDTQAGAGVLAALAIPLWIAGVVVETLVALGLGRFLARVRPDLLAPPARIARGATPGEAA
jgi:cobalt/nickel transport system permease protein